ncbi:hypothetical protein JCGZ_26039 [Jatropha curcas]|uniref:Pentacotripeptide-repeat region of PRORP domain-containing protein n=1 Tax=Jatropha curcas TaxID=180498 RepID=A0A067JHH1_JATCU|nr:pentatricopeptide repeat-containing protein At5g52850, chloroplastic [Jatropha curcas]KDP22208.1 hypothetical protein JCGZ_26039 [Jatropha curcas]
MIRKAASSIINRTEPLQRFEDVCSQIVSFCNSKSSKQGVCIHSPIIKLGIQDNLYLNNNLLSLYWKCLGVQHARQFFDEMPCRDVVSWTGILSAYTKDEKYEEALDIFDLMVLSGPYPNAFTFSSVLRSCAAVGDFSYGKRSHASLIKHGFESNQILGSSLIDFYSKFDSAEEALKHFRYMDNNDTVSWTMVICTFAQARKWGQALRLYIDMIKAEVSPNEFTFVKLLTACGFIGLIFGKLVHAHMIILGVELNLVVKTALVDMYSRCHRMEDALKVSKLTPEYDVLLWTTIISGLNQNLKLKEAVAVFQEMQISGILGNSFTYSSMLSTCTSIPSLDLGRQIHSRVIKTGLENDVPIGNALVDMYMKCSLAVEDGLRVFRGIYSPNVISWTSLIGGFAEHGFQQNAFDSFTEMMAVGVQPNSFTLSTILRACSVIKSLNQTFKLHGYIIKTNADHDIVVGNALVDAYAGSGRVDDAWRIVRDMNQRDAVTYTIIATRFNQMGHHELALDVIGHMFSDDVRIDGFSMASFFSASAGLGRIEIGKQLQCYSVKSGLSSWISVLNSLVDLYGKCGQVHDAHKAFREIPEPDVVSWNGFISGLASNGYISSALSAFDDMRLTGVKPDSVTFLSLLFTCSHGCLVDLGLQYFQSMRETHGLEPQLDHYVCLVDLLGRAGRLEEAMNALKTMPFKPDTLIYKTLLAACRVHRNLPLGEDIARRGLELNPSDPTFYVLLANLYEDCGRSDLSEMTRRTMKERGLNGNG